MPSVHEVWIPSLLWKYFYTANSHWPNLVRKAVFILEDCFGFYKNHSKTYRDVAGMRERSGSYSLSVLQLDHKPVFLGQSSRGLHKHGGRSVDADAVIVESVEILNIFAVETMEELQYKLVAKHEKHEKRGQRCTAPCRATSLLLTMLLLLISPRNLISPNNVHHILRGS